MGIIINTIDFTGYHELAQNPNLTTKLNAAITRFERNYLYKILSNAIVPPAAKGYGDSFIADCQANGGVPVIARNAIIFNPLVWQVGRFLHESTGMKDIMLGLIFYEFIAMKESIDTQNGVAQANIDAATKAKLSGAYRFAEKRWNDAVKQIKTVQWWLRYGNGNSGAGNGGYNDYPEYIQPQKFNTRYGSII